MIDFASLEEPALSVTPAPRQVLLAEDDAVYRCLLQRLLERASFQVITVDDGLAALQAAQNDPAPRLLILDWVMPGLDGPEVCRRLRAARTAEAYQYILLLTSKDTKTDTVTGLEAGADDYLTKPFDTQELLARLRTGTRILELQDRLLNAHKKLKYEATHDSLTGLWNRLAWRKLLTAEFERAHRAATSIAVLMMDIDHFKLVNDTYGHSAGDAVLRNIGDALRSLIRAYDHAGRYGGEEFIVLAQQLSFGSVRDYAERIRTTMSQLITRQEQAGIAVTVSIGGVFTDVLEEGVSPDSMVRIADRALYRAKALGRDCVYLEDVSPVSQPAVEPQHPHAEILHVV
jgi:diguanylate cyclase (GGDEF)-like protein